MSTSTDEQVTQDLIETLEDGKEGFARAAERLEGTERADLCAPFADFSAQRGRFAAELQAMAASYGDRVDKNGSVAGTLHRGWMAIKDAVSGMGDAEGVLDAAEQGEDHAVAEYERALQEDISPDLRAVVERQLTEIRAAHDMVRSARDTAAG
jgi:uncharacterized protein (TIGR02284 family)